MDIDENIKQLTKYCTRNFQCLEGENHRLFNGNVKRIIDGTVFIVNCNEIICPYKMTFGSYIICNCPTRKELYKKN
jgi:hypothetical protein